MLLLFSVLVFIVRGIFTTCFGHLVYSFFKNIFWSCCSYLFSSHSLSISFPLPFICLTVWFVSLSMYWFDWSWWSVDRSTDRIGLCQLLLISSCYLSFELLSLSLSLLIFVAVLFCWFNFFFTLLNRAFFQSIQITSN